MSNPKYNKGVKLERDVVELFKSVGFTACRTAGSHGLYDVIAVSLNKERVYFISCKLRGALPTEEWNELVLHAQLYGGVAILASKHPAGGVKLEWLVTTKKPRENPSSEIDVYQDSRGYVRSFCDEPTTLFSPYQEVGGGYVGREGYVDPGV